MPTAEIGRWEFSFPEGWELKDSGIGVSYMEAPDGTKGLYSKTVKAEPPEPSARELAEYIQNVHRRGFDSDSQANWLLRELSGNQVGDLYWSKLDLWDEEARYRVLSLVVCTASYAIQLTMHDYDCPVHEVQFPAFASVEHSVRLTGAA